MSSILNRVRQTITSPTGTGGPLVLNSSAFSLAHTTILSAGGVDQAEYCYVIEEGTDFEIQRGIWTLSSNQLARNTPVLSSIAGTTGTTKMNLSGNATIRVIIEASELGSLRGVRAITGATDTIANGDNGFALVYNRATAIAAALAAPSGNSFRNGWMTNIKNIGAGTTTITATGATITSNGVSSSTLALQQYESALLISDGTNYYALIMHNPIWSAAAVLTTGQQTQAANNLLVPTGAATQSLTTGQQQQIRANISAPGVIKITKFTANGTWTPDAHLISAVVEAIGGGGGGGGSTGSATFFTGGGGGGSGSYARSAITAATAGASKAVTIGAGGSASTNSSGGSGGDTSVGTLVIGKGGSGGNVGTSGAFGIGGAGGVAGTGDDTRPGTPGGNSAYQTGTSVGIVLPTGFGAASRFGGGGAQASPVNGAISNGNAATGFGAGGGGGASNYVASNSSGGAGSPGYVVITEYCTQ